VFARSQLFYVFFFSVVCFMMVAAVPWPAAAKIVPLVVGGLTMLFAILSFTNQIFPRPLIANGADGTVALGKLHMDIASDHGHLSTRTILFRATMFFGWLVGFMCCMAIIGLIPTVPIFVILFMRLEGQEKWKLVLPQAIILTTAIYFAFDQMLALPWPPTLLGMLIPSLRGVVPSV
jgi:hypothetical protein